MVYELTYITVHIYRLMIIFLDPLSTHGSSRKSLHCFLDFQYPWGPLALLTQIWEGLLYYFFYNFLPLSFISFIPLYSSPYSSSACSCLFCFLPLAFWNFIVHNPFPAMITLKKVWLRTPLFWTVLLCSDINLWETYLTVWRELLGKIRHVPSTFMSLNDFFFYQ